MAYKRKGSSLYWCKVNGKRVSTGTDNLEAAQAFENKLRLDAWAGERMGAKPVRSYADLCERWREEKRHKVSFKDDERHMEWWARHLSGVKDIRTITREMVDTLVQKHRAVTPAVPSPGNNTANHYVNGLSAMLNAAAREWGWLESSPKLRRYPVPEGADAWFTPEQWFALRQELPDHLKAPAQFALATGLRKEKVFTLERGQIDMQARRMTFKGTANKLGNTIPLNDTAMAALAMAAAGPQHITRVFAWVTPGGKLEALNDYGRAWWKALERAGLGRYNEAGLWEGELNWHSLRHTFASWLGQEGVPGEIVDRLGGWKGNSRNTRLRYTHLAVDHLRPHASVIDTVLLRAEAVELNAVGVGQ